MMEMELQGTGRYSRLLWVDVVAASEGNVIFLQNASVKWNISFAFFKLHFGPNTSCLSFI